MERPFKTQLHLQKEVSPQVEPIFETLYTPILSTNTSETNITINTTDTAKTTFVKKYPQLVMPLSRLDANKQLKEKFEYVSSNEINKFEYYNPSPFAHADASSILGPRDSMEDTYAIAKLSDNCEFYGVFDGHGGWEISVLLKDILPKKIIDLLENDKTFDYTDLTIVTNLVRKVCRDIGNEIFELENWNRIGSTAVFVLRFDKYVYVVNIGDSTAVIFDEQHKIVYKTKNHKPNDANEKSRIEKMGSMVYFGRVDCSLAVSRSFGDNRFNQRQNGCDCFNTVISCEPDIYQFIIPENSNHYLVLGSDGLWDNCQFLNNKITSETFFFEKLAENVILQPPRDASINIVNMAFDTNVYDNITVVVVRLN